MKKVSGLVLIVFIFLCSCGDESAKKDMTQVKDLEYNIYDLNDDSNVKMSFKAIANFQTMKDFERIAFTDREARDLQILRKDLFLQEGGSTLILKKGNTGYVVEEYLTENFVGDKTQTFTSIYSCQYASLINDEIKKYPGKKIRIITKLLK